MCHQNITAANGDKYSQSGLNPAATGRAVVGDPETSEINQLFLAYNSGKTTATLGRQRLVLDGAGEPRLACGQARRL